MRIAAEFVTSAAAADGFPRDGLPEVAFVGRSNVGKSSLINALTRQRLARTSAAPGKTRLANVYRISREGAPAFYLVDLPGYGYARGGAAAARDFDELTRAYFAQAERLRPAFARAGMQRATARQAPLALGRRSAEREGGPPPVEKKLAGLLVVDSRHPGLDSDVSAWQWLRETVADRAIVATKIDKLARGERIRAMREFQSVFEDPVLPVSAVTGEGLDELWKLIDRLANSRNNLQHPRRSSRNSSSPRRRSRP